MTQTYDTLIRAKGMFDDCETLEEMAQRAEDMAKELRDMHAAGITLRDTVQDDYAFCETDNKEVAEKFKMNEADEDEDEEDDE